MLQTIWEKQKRALLCILLAVIVLMCCAILSSCKTDNNKSSQSSTTTVSKYQNETKTGKQGNSSKVNPNNSIITKNNNIKQADTADILEKMKAAKENDFPTEHISPDNLSLVKSINLDLNDDGAKETITIKSIANSPRFILSVNAVSVLDEFESGELFDGFAIVDINKADKYKEIAVHTPGPSDDDEYLIYWYDGTSIKKVGNIGRWPRFAGNGFVYVDSWISFWQNTDKYVLTKQRTLQLVSQPFHYVGVKCKVNKGFPIFLSQTSGKIVANLRKGSTIFVTLSDLSGITNGDYDNWYLVRSESNLVGWVRESNLVPNTDVKVAD